MFLREQKIFGEYYRDDIPLIFYQTLNLLEDIFLVKFV